MRLWIVRCVNSSSLWNVCGVKWYVQILGYPLVASDSVTIVGVVWFYCASIRRARCRDDSAAQIIPQKSGRIVTLYSCRRESELVLIAAVDTKRGKCDASGGQ